MFITFHMDSLLFFYHSLYNIKVITQKVVLLNFLGKIPNLWILELVKYHNSHTPPIPFYNTQDFPNFVVEEAMLTRTTPHCYGALQKHTFRRFIFRFTQKNILWIKEETFPSKLHCLAASATLPSIAASLAAQPSVYFWL